MPFSFRLAVDNELTSPELPPVPAKVLLTRPVVPAFETTRALLDYTSATSRPNHQPSSSRLRIPYIPHTFDTAPVKYVSDT